MKKLMKLLVLVFVLTSVIFTTSCKKENNVGILTTDAECTVLDLMETEEGKVFVGIFVPSENTLYVGKNEVIKKDVKYKVLTISESEKNKLPKLESGLGVGKNFAGWYSDETLETRVATYNDETTKVYAKYVGYGEAGLTAVICITIVFLMLAFLYGITALLKFVAPKNKPQENTSVQEKTPFSINDIKDEDMMVAGLIATIEYRNETKDDVRIVSIKEVK